MGSEVLKWTGMHGCNSGSAHVVNAEVDSMGAVVDGGVGIGLKTSQDETVHNPLVLAFGKASTGGERNPGASGELELSPRVTAAQPVDESCPGQTNGFGNIKVDRKGAPTKDQNSSVAVGLKSFDPESCCAQTSLARDVNNDTHMCTDTKNGDANGSALEQILFEKKLSSTASEAVRERSKTNIGESGTTAKNEHASGYANHSGSGSIIKNEDFHMNSSSMQNNLKDSSSIRGHHNNDSTVLKADKGESVVMMDCSNSTKDDNCERLEVSKDVSISTNPQTTLADKVTTAASDCQPCSPHHLKLADKAHEDSILEEARIIEVKRKRIIELSAHTLPSPILRKSHWDFVLEEMAWLANDFAKERLWKTTAAAVLAKAVKQFWYSVELQLEKDDPDHNCIGGAVACEKVDSNEASRDKRKNSEMYLFNVGDIGQESSNCLEEGQNARKKFGLKVHSYAMRYIMDSRSRGISSQVEAPASPDKISDSVLVDMSGEENLTSRCAKYRLPDVHEEQKATTSGNDAGESSHTKECCQICWKCIDEISSFGLFPGCMHQFCLSCISRWRQNGTASWKIKKSCPICRTFSFFTVPSPYWLTGDAKTAYIERYLQRCSSIDCRFFSHGDGYCPQRQYCFYRHVVHPGSYRWMHHRSPPPPQTVDEEVVADDEMAIDAITDFEIGIRPKAKD